MHISQYQKARVKAKIRKYQYLLQFRLAHLLAGARRHPWLGRLKKQHLMAAGSGFIAIVLLLVWVLAPTTKAITKTLTSNDLMTGTTDFNQVQLSNNNSSISLQRGDIGQWTHGDNTQLLPVKMNGDSNLVYGPNGRLFFMTFISGCRFFSFEIETQEWKELASPPVGCGDGSQVVYDGAGSLYYVAGNSSTAFFKYDIDTNSWSRLADTAMPISDGASMVYVSSGSNSALYLTRGSSSASFWRYNISTNQWVTRASFPTTTSIVWGVNIVWDQGNYIYAINNDRNEFKRYSIASDSWTNMTAPANTSTMRNKMIWVNGAIYNVQVHVWNNPPETSFMLRYTPSTDSWSSLAQPPSGTYRDFPPVAAYDGSDNVYTMFGAYERPVLYRYKLSEQRWIGNSLFKLQDSTFTHWDLIYDNNRYAYFVGGQGWGNMDRLYRLDLTNNDLVQLAGQTLGSTGVTGVYYNNALYLMDWFDNKGFRKYDIASNSWTWLQEAPFNTAHGASIIDGGDGYLYATFGNNRNFYRYSEAAGWVKMTDLPQNIYHDGAITRVGRTIYALAGNSTSYFMRYNMDTNAWTTLETPIGGVNHGDFFTGDGTRYLYAGMATRTEPQNRTMYQYDTVNSTWKRVANLPASTQVGTSAFYDNANNRVYVAQGVYQSNLWYWTSTATNYVTTGNWYSKSLDMKHVANWQSLQATMSGTGTATFFTRTSDNGGMWSDWQQVSGTTVQSPKKRYLQIKVVLSGNGSSTPTVSDIAVTYSQDITAPNLPSQFTAQGVKGGETLTSGQTYTYQHPYFSWSGATDDTGGSGVAGYYVYFGTNSDADPFVDGNYQTSSEYTVTSAMEAGSVYYLKLKTKDNMGNVSDAATYFSYRYWYISPPGSVLLDSRDDFAAATNTGVNIDNSGTMSLVQQAKGAWATGPMAMLPNSTNGPSAVVAGDFMYVQRGSNTPDFWRYNIQQQLWESLASTPANVTTGSSITWDGGNFLYAIRGGNTNGFYRYNIQNNAWETLLSLPAFAQAGSDIKYIGNNRVAIFFAGVSEFYFYRTDTQIFETRTPSPLITNSNAGGGIWYDGNDTIYAYHGAYDMWQPERLSLQAYIISQDTWRPLAKPPVNAWYAQNNLVGDGQGNLYVFNNDYAQNLSHNTMAMKYTIATNTWKVLPNATGVNVRGTAASDGKRYIYEIPSQGNSRRILQYDTWDDRFVPQESAGIASWQRLPWDDQSSWNWVSGSATTAVYDGVDNVYAIGANNGTWARFMRYSIAAGETKYLSPPPQVGQGGSLAILSGTIYYLPAGTTNILYRYEMGTDSWSRMANIPATVVRPGANSLITVGNELYALIGNTSRLMYKFTPNSSTGTWTRMADAPGNVFGGATVYDGANYLYVAAGNGTNSFYRYDISANTWSVMTSLPTVMASSGGAMMLKGAKIYATRGNTTPDMYVYDIDANTWDTAPTAPDTFRQGGIFVPINNEYAYVFTGQDSPDMWRFNFPGTNAAYSGLATHISQPISIDGIFDYAGIKAQVTTPADTKIEFWTRTSPDGVNWNDWAITDQVKQYSGSMSSRVASPAQKYIQIKAVMYSFKNQFTPVIDNYALDYYFDVSPPSNPTLLSAYTDSDKVNALTNNIWYNDTTPFFDWPDPGEVGGATDGPLGSNIKGYWVYVGTDPTAQPRTAGVFVSGSQYAPTLTAAGTYYVRLQAVDITGNVDGNVFQPFIYKFDNVPPTSPALITVTPSGFTSTNKYTFQWPNSFDANSGIDKYCYHTGALSGPFAIETCQDELELSEVPAAYRPGTNVFYLRTKDVAGNFSTNYTTVSYYYSTDPPSPVTNLRAVPPVSSANLFAFTWDYPALFSGDPEQLSYCYSINELPSPTNTTCTGDKFIGAFKAATQQGTNILYMVAKDEAGNVNWNSYASANFIANTVSPGIPLNLVVTDTSDRLSNRWALTATWDPPTFVGNGVAKYVVERSEDNHTFAEIGQVSNTAYVDLSVQPEVRYYYRVRAADNVDNRGGPSSIVAQSAKGNFTTPPQIVSEPRVQPSFDQATISWVTARASTSFVYYGTNPTQLNQSKGSLDNVSEHSVTITGLQPSTNYYFKVQSFDNDRSYDLNSAFSQLYTFRTSANARIFNVQATDIGLSSALLNWQSSVPTKTRIQYGPTTDYGYTQDDPAGFATNHFYKLNELASGTTYHYRIISTTEYGSTVTSDDYTLTTVARPVISNIRFQPLPDELSIAVKVSWTTNVPTSSDITYRGLGVQKKESQSDLVTDHEIILRDLAGSTDYEFDIQGRDQYGNLASSERQTWRSTIDTRPPAISDLSVNVTTMEALGNSKAQLIITWKTDEPSTTQIQYDRGNAKSLTKKTPFDPEPTVSHVVVISNLELAEVYRIQPVSRDISGNTTYGVQLATVTPDKQQSPLDAVLNTLQRIFRF